MSSHSRHHYVFQHTILGGLVLREPMEIWPRFQNGEEREFVGSLWAQAASLIPEPERLAFPDLQCVSTQIRSGDTCHLAIVFSFPEPRVSGEAYLGALVWRRPPESIDRDDEDNPAAHPLVYFTLEHAGSAGRALSTCLCAWKRKDRNDLEHMNYGSGPYPEVSGFLRAIAGYVDGPPRAAA